MQHFDKIKKVVLKINFLNYVNEEIFSQYNYENSLHLITFYNKNLLFIEYNYEIYDKKFLIIIYYLR